MREPYSDLTRKLIRDGLQKSEEGAMRQREDIHGPLRLMASAEGYVMVRRPGCVPFVLREQDWLQLRERAA